MASRALLAERGNPDQQLGLWPEFDQLYGQLDARPLEWREGAWVVAITGQGLAISLTPSDADRLANALETAAQGVRALRKRRPT